MSIAHYFTFLRILITPIFPILYLKHNALGIGAVWVPYILIFLLAICEFSDFFDGFLARKKRQVTDLGKVLDPMADSLLMISIFFTFTRGAVRLPVLLVLIFLYRDFFVSTLRTICALKGVALAARISGKIKSVLQASVAFTILVSMIPYTLGYISVGTLRAISVSAVSIAAAYTVVSLIDYFYANRLFIKKALGKSS